MLQPRKHNHKGVILASYLLFLVLLQSALGNLKEAHENGEDEEIKPGGEGINSNRVKRDDSGLTTVFLINNEDDYGRNGRSSRPSGVLTSTARTFVHDGTTTEYGTQVIGTTLENGKYYAHLVHTSSRIYFGSNEKTAIKSKPDERAFYKSRYIGIPQNFDNYIQTSVFHSIQPSEPVFIYPTRGANSRGISIESSDDTENRFVGESNYRNSNGKKETTISQNGESENFSNGPRKGSGEREVLENLIRLEKVDLLDKGRIDEIKPTRVFSNQLPTVTIRYDFSPSGFSINAEEKKEERIVKTEKSKLRSGKSFIAKPPVATKYDTVTYTGFADFVTTVGNTVIIFMPSTRSGDRTVTETLASVSSASDVSDPRVKTTIKTFLTYSPGMVTKTMPGHGLSMQTTLATMVADRKSKGLREDLELKSSVLAEEQISFENPIYSEPDLPEPMTDRIVIEPSESVTYSSISRATATEPLETFSTAITKTFSAGKTDQPLGLLKSIGGTKAHNGTTTHFTSLIYGTYLGGSYAQILQTSSSVFYALENRENIRPTVTLNGELNASETGKTTAEFAEETTPATTEQGDELLETSGPDYGDDETHYSDKTGESVSGQGVTEANEINDKGRQIKYDGKEGGIGFDSDKSQKEDMTEKGDVFETATQELITRLVPTTVYKTFTYLTTFFIPSDETTTTSIRSREVVTSDVDLVTKIIDPELVYKEVLPTSDVSVSTKSGGLDALNDLNDVDEEFRLPSVRILSPEEIIVIEDTADDDDEKEKEEERNLQTTTDEESTERGTTNVFLTTWNTSPNTEGTDTETTLPETTSEMTAADAAADDDDDDRDTHTTPLTTTSETSEKISSTTVEMEEPKISENKTAEKGDSGDEEIEVIFKTLYTTYTYLTTYFQESTTSVSSSEVVVTNVITSTLAIPSERPEPTSVLKQEVEATETIEGGEGDINPTNTFNGGSVTKFFDDDEDDDDDEEDNDDGDDDFTLSPSKESAEGEVTETPSLEIGRLKTLYTTYTYYTTLIDEGSTEVQSRTEVVTNVVGPNSVSVLPSSILQNEALLKSKFEMLLREQQSLRSAASKASESPSSTLVRSSVRNSSLRSSINPGSTTGYRPSSTATQPLSSFSSKQRSDTTGRLSSSTRGNSFQKFSIRPSASVKPKSVPFTRKFNEPSEIDDSNRPENRDDNSVKRLIIKGDKKDRTVIRKRIRTKLRPLAKTIDVDEKLGITTIRLDPTPVDDEKFLLQTMVTDVKSSSSGGGRQIRIAPPEPVERIGEFFYDDQISSESNTEEIEPSPTLILQTSYTTFTYFTTVYKGSSSSDVVSRLETVTNVVTETVKPDLLETQNLSPEDATLPITYFTTFTYWTTLYKDGNTVITSREETVSNVVTPKIDPSSTHGVAEKTEITSERSKEDDSVSAVFVPGFVTASVSKPAADIVEAGSSKSADSKNDIAGVLLSKEDFVEKLKPTTFYTTYTYFTTSYIGDSTVLKSRLETVTSVIVPTATISDISDNDLQTIKSVNLESTETVSKSEEKTNSESSANAFPTGLLSTVVSSNVEGGKTTLFSTDIYGTFIDGLYAKILESTTKIVTPAEVTSTPTKSSDIQKTGIVSVNEGKIIDADGVSTTFFTTKAIGTSIEELYAQIVETTTSVLVDNDKKSSLASLRENQGGGEDDKTGLLNLTEGSIIQDGTTTFYESRVVGTVIEGKYVQIIESKSSLKIEPSIAPSVTIETQITPTSTVEITSPSPSAVEGSMVDETVSSKEEHEGSEEEEGEEGEGEDERDKGRVKSRLTFQTKKRTFTPVIRPFASRNRPTFLPKKKSLGTTGAQTITRANFTPTITATLATKTEGYSSRGRFGGGRKSSSPNYTSDVKPTAASGRKFGRNRSSFGYSSSGHSSSSYSPSRNRISSSRITSTPALNSARGRANFRGSTSRAGYNFESGSFKQSIGAGRPRIRPTLTNFPGRGSPSATATTNLPSDRGNDLTTVVTENDDEGSFTEDEDDVPVTVAPPTTTEDSNLARRNNNPLLRFRRPLLPKTPTTASPPKTTTAQAPRRGILGGRNNRFAAPTTPRASARTTVNVGRSNLPSRSRPTNNLFPPRGLFNKKPPAAEVEKEEEEFFDEEEDEEFESEDNNYDESSAKEVEAEVEIKKTEKVGRGRAYNPVSIRPFNLQRRSKRQASDYGSKSNPPTPRYRRPKLKAHQAQDRIDYYDEEVIAPPEVPKTSRNGRVHKPRSRSQSHQTQTTNAPAQSRIRPTTATSQNSQRPQFTLREKDANPRTSNFRRGQGSSSRRKGTSYKATEPTVSRKSSSRSRSQTQNQALGDLTRNNQRRGSYSNGRKLNPTRSRSRFGESEDAYTYQSSAFDGTITVTHKVPSEVTIPIVNGKVTEYRNVITAKPSIEVLGPHQYAVTSTNGATVLFLNREVTETLNNGFTEVTKFLIRETPTTSVAFTPTTIRGRKTSFSHVVPSTVYDVENVVTTIQPQIAANAPLANLLLSQLLLGNLGNVSPNQPLGGLPLPQTAAATPTTEYKVRTTSYVTTVTDHISTVLPITFRGKEILTTIVDDTVNVITATEYITDTVVVTPSLSPNQQINSLLLPALLQAQLLNPNQQPSPQQLPPIPAFTQLPFAPPLGLDQLKFEALQEQQDHEELTELTEDKPSRDNDLRSERGSDFVGFDEEVEEARTPSRKRKSRKKTDKKRYEPEPAGREIVTLYVSGRRPGEFSTILSTVATSGETSVIVRKREAPSNEFDRMPIEASESKARVSPSEESFPAEVNHDREPVKGHDGDYVTPGTPDIFVPVRSEEINSETQSLESVLGDVSKHTTQRLERSKATKTSLVEPTVNDSQMESEKSLH